MIRRSGPLAWLLLALAVALLLPAAPAAAAEDASIAHVESTAGGLRVLVTVPPTAQVDLAGVAASLDSQPLDATATLAESDTVVKRTTVLAIDTSESMAKQGRFEAAQAAANEFLDTVPADVEVGIVTFDGEVTTALEPTTDRGAARAVVSGLELAAGTLLYDGVRAAVDLAGTEGQRSVLVLSDGADTGGATSLDEITSEVVDTGTLVDVVSLDQTGPALDALRQMTEAGNGRVVEASGGALAEAFAAEAELLAS
ncbi:MAG TPA: vWA domain-containing protein, partial [Nocardioides sp.]|nr:vWA domain-containing protein [Nocardioides sp.]